MPSLERSKTLFLLDARVNPDAVISGDFSIKGLLAILDRQVKAMRARRIVFDAVDTLLQLHDNPARERHELCGLHEWLLDRRLTAIMTVKARRAGRAAAVCIPGLHGGLRDPRRPARHWASHDAPLESGQVSWFGIRPQRISLHHRGERHQRHSDHQQRVEHRAPVAKVSSGQARAGWRARRRLQAWHQHPDRRDRRRGKDHLGLRCLPRRRVGAASECLYLNFEESPESMVSNMLSPGCSCSR